MESELVQQVGSNARLILHHCKSQPNKVLRHIVAIVSQLPNIIRCNFQDVSKLLALLPSGQDTDFRCVMLQEIEFNLDECPNKRHAELQVHPLWVEIRREVAEYLLGDLCGIVMEYVKAYSQRFYVGLIVKTYTEDQWYVGRITKIATVQGIPFLFIEYYMHEFDCSDWIPATSANVKCFYNSQGERIEWLSVQ